jgi:chromosome segregation ATPase
LTRQTNARLSKLTASIQYLHKKTAAISGQFDAVRQSLAEIESAFDNERRETSEATSIFIDRLTREVSVGLDGISSVVDATIEAQSQLISIARQIAEGAGAGLNSGDSPVA